MVCASVIERGPGYRVWGFSIFQILHPEAADLLDDFARWSTQVTVEAGYVGSAADSVTLPCSGIVQLPATYYEVRVRADVDVMRSEKEPKRLLIEGIP